MSNLPKHIRVQLFEVEKLHDKTKEALKVLEVLVVGKYAHIPSLTDRSPLKVVSVVGRLAHDGVPSLELENCGPKHTICVSMKFIEDITDKKIKSKVKKEVT